MKSAFLGWTKPVRLHEIRLQGIDGSSVLDIPKVESKAPLWSIVLGRAGLGGAAQNMDGIPRGLPFLTCVSFNSPI